MVVLALPPSLRLGRQRSGRTNRGDQLMTYEQWLATRALWDIERQLLLEDEESETA